jgi:hypothetical protein
MDNVPATTTFTSRGRLAGLIRDEAPAGAGQNRATAAPTADTPVPAIDKALYYRARLSLGDFPRPGR